MLKMFVALCLILGVIVGVYTMGLLRSDEEAPSGEQAVRYIFLLDQSASIPAEQQTQWVKTFDEMMVGLKPGDAVLIFGIHDQSLNAGPIYKNEVPPLDLDPTYEELTGVKKRLAIVRKEAKEEFEKSLNPQSRSFSTDIFSAIDRVQPDQNSRKTVLVFLSDMLNSTTELNMERVQLREGDIAIRLNPVLARHRWQKGQLAGAEVHCLLNAVGIRQQAPLNDRRILRLFYATLFEALGAELKTFDTHRS